MLVLHSHGNGPVSCSAVRAVRTKISREEEQLGEQQPFCSGTCPRHGVLSPRAVLCLACFCAAGRHHSSLGSSLVPSTGGPALQARLAEQPAAALPGWCSGRARRAPNSQQGQAAFARSRLKALAPALLAQMRVWEELGWCSPAEEGRRAAESSEASSWPDQIQKSHFHSGSTVVAAGLR